MPSWSPRRRRALGAALVLLAVVLAGCSPGPEPPSVCAVCDDRMVDAAEELGANVSVSHSEVDVHVRTDGSARWVVRVDLQGEGVAAFRTNETLRETLVERRLERSAGPRPAEPANLTARMDDRTLVVAFDDAAFASREPGGVLLVEGFHHQTESGFQAPFRLAADRLVVHSPDGWAVLNDVPGAEEGSGTVVWRDHVDERTYVVLGPDASPIREGAGQAAVAAAVAGWVTIPVVAGSIVPTLLVLAALAVASRRVDRTAPTGTEDVRTVERQRSVALTGAVVLAVATGIALWHQPASQAVGDVLSTVSGPDAGSSLWAIVLFVGLLAAPPAGAAWAAGLLAHRRPAVRWPPAVLAVAAVPLEVFWLVLIAADSAGLVGMVLVPVGVVTAALCLAAFVLGRRSARSRGWVPDADEDERPRRGDEHAGE